MTLRQSRTEDEGVISETEVNSLTFTRQRQILRPDTFDSVHRHVAALLGLTTARTSSRPSTPSISHIPPGTGLLSTRRLKTELGGTSALRLSNSRSQSPLSSHRYRLDANHTPPPYELILLVRSFWLPPCPPLSTRSIRGTVEATMSSARRTDSPREQPALPRSCPGTDTKRYVRPSPPRAPPVAGVGA
jgi:hypothetical protein